MKFKTIIFASELNFRKYVVQHPTSIRRIIIFEDTLEQVILFYCFMKDCTIVATKVLFCNDFSLFKEIYLDLANKLKLNIALYHNDIGSLDFICN